MSQRPRNDLPRLSGRPDGPPHAAGRETQTVFRRFFELLERLDRPHPAGDAATKSAPPARKAGK